ncbi:MAG: flagellar filament capping protein FliD [Rhodobacteraceae bacterium]|nr:flagellar filament capping protein FliD [Paracoccaceae bacterium]
MPTDFLTSLNANGSGLNIRELSSSLAEAEISPRRSLTMDRIDQAELQLSGNAQLRSQAEQVDEALGLISGLSPFAISSSDPAITSTIIDPTLAQSTSSTIEVSALAKAQILNFGGFTDPTAALGGGSLTVSFGSWSTDNPPAFAGNGRTDQVLTLSPEATLNELATAFSSLEGVSAQVVDVGDGTYSIGLISDAGANNALSIAFKPPPDPSQLAVFDISDDPSPAQAQAAQSAALTINGIAVTRDGNEVDDLIPGVLMTLTELTNGPVTLTSRANTEGALEVMQGFVDILNATTRLIDGLTRTGLSGGDAGALASDRTIAEQFLSGFERSLARGYGSSDGRASTFLSDLGILTERDGTFSFDAARFTAAIEANPARLNGLLRDTLIADGASVTGTPLTGTPTGSYAFERDVVTGAATLAGRPVSGVEQADGTWIYTVTSETLRGISLTVEADAQSATVEFATSMVSALQTDVSDLLGSNGALSSRDDALKRTLDDQASALAALDLREEEIEARYLARFTQMEQIISELNSVGDFLDNLLDSLNPDS